jgi:hypothetical protein
MNVIGPWSPFLTGDVTICWYIFSSSSCLSLSLMSALFYSANSSSILLLVAVIIIRLRCLVFSARFFIISSAFVKPVRLLLARSGWVEGPRADMVLIPVIEVTSSEGLIAFLDGSRARVVPPR